MRYSTAKFSADRWRTKDGIWKTPEPPRANAKGFKDRNATKKRKRPGGRPGPREYKAIIQGLMRGYQGLSDVLDGKPLAEAQALFLGASTEDGCGVTLDFPKMARDILGWQEPTRITVDPEATVPW